MGKLVPFRCYTDLQILDPWWSNHIIQKKFLLPQLSKILFSIENNRPGQEDKLDSEQDTDDRDNDQEEKWDFGQDLDWQPEPEPPILACRGCEHPKGSKNKQKSNVHSYNIDENEDFDN